MTRKTDRHITFDSVMMLTAKIIIISTCQNYSFSKLAHFS